MLRERETLLVDSKYDDDYINDDKTTMEKKKTSEGPPLTRHTGTKQLHLSFFHRFQLLLESDYRHE